MKVNEFEEYQKATTLDSIAILARAILFNRVSIVALPDKDKTVSYRILVDPLEYE